MPPRKNSESKPSTSNKKVQKIKPTEKKLKPKLKKPTVKKLNIPVGAKNVTNNDSTKLVKKSVKSLNKLSLERKLELANEVANAQLVKPTPVILKIEPDLPEVKQPKKRGRKKNIPEPLVAASDSEDAFEQSPVKKKIKRVEPLKINKKKLVVVKETKVETSSVLPKKKIKQNKLAEGLTKSRITKTSKRAANGLNKTPPWNKAEQKEPKTRKRKFKAATGKKDQEPDQAIVVQQSPSILDQVEDVSPDKVANDTNKANDIIPSTIDSRKKSCNSECLSWTRDISSSSTTTCLTVLPVSASDFIRIDKKMPLVKLSGIDHQLNGAKRDTSDSLSSSESDSDSSETDKESSTSSIAPVVETRSLDLSTSSITFSKSQNSGSHQNSLQISIENEDINKLNNALDKLTSKLKKFDLEIINWIGYENTEPNTNFKKIQTKILQVLKEESEVIAHCQCLKKLLSDSSTNDYDQNVENDTNVQCANNHNSSAKTLSNDVQNDRVTNEQNKSPTRIEGDNSDDEENNFTSDKVKYMSFEQNYDDDDALSLFAESITGMESSKLNSSTASVGNVAESEECAPKVQQAERWEPPKKISYQPVECDIGKPIIDDKPKTVCEKQNADSTSIYKDTEGGKNTTISFIRPNPVTKPISPTVSSINIGNMLAMNKKTPILMSYLFKPLTGVKSIVFRGICFYNLLSSCKNTNCRFPHLNPDRKEITMKLTMLNEEMFIQEYMLLRGWPVLRRKYGMCFVIECRRRELTRILVEMAIDFVMKANEHYREDVVTKVEVVEYVLLHLNDVDLMTCEDLLMYNVCQGMLLCEVFMQVIADTQNFSRFKPVFMALTKFILRHNRKFSLNVATHILERLCILPCERPLLEALLDIVKHTDRAILENSKMGHFEKQLAVLDKSLFDQLIELNKNGRPVLANLYDLPQLVNRELESVMPTFTANEREKRFTSPDTTNLDNMNKTAEEPTITRTIDFNRPHVFNIQRSFSNSNSPNDSNEEFRPKPLLEMPFTWRGFGMRGMPPRMRLDSPRPFLKRHIHQQMRFGPPNYPRRPGPEYY